MHIFTLVYNNNTPTPTPIYFMRQCENLKWTAKLKLGILLSTPPAHRMRISQFGESLPPHAFFGWVCHPHPSNTFKTMLRTFKTMQKKIGVSVAYISSGPVQSLVQELCIARNAKSLSCLIWQQGTHTMKQIENLPRGGASFRHFYTSFTKSG